MILQNGFSSFFIGQGVAQTITHGIPSNGVQGEWSGLAPCQWRVVRKDFQANSTSGQPKTYSSYEILIDDSTAWSERVRLYDQNNTLIGEYSVIQEEHLHILKIRRLMV